MYRKWLLMMLSLAVCLSLVACGDKQPPADSTPNNEVEDNVSDASITYNPEEFLPVGSVVMLNGGNKRVMICGRIQAQAGTDVIYDYSACYYPEGILDPKSMFFFNRGDIETVYFRGYEDQEELDYRHEVLEQLGELEIRDGVIVPKAD
jgi:hypothetical protein